VKQAAAAAQHACQLIVERLRIQLAGNAEARRIVQQRVHRGVGDPRDRL
jgi:hypothetical protein